MKIYKVLITDIKSTIELHGCAGKLYNGIKLDGSEVYYLNHQVNEDFTSFKQMKT